MKLDEAKKILKNAGYIIESSMSLKDKIDNAKKFNSNIDKMKKDAVNIFKQVFHEDEVTDRHLNYDPKGGPWQEGKWSGDEELENFISDLAFEYQNTMS